MNDYELRTSELLITLITLKTHKLNLGNITWQIEDFLFGGIRPSLLENYQIEHSDVQFMRESAHSDVQFSK